VKGLTLCDGRRIAWREAGSGPPLVLLHGWAMSGAVFGEALLSLSDDFRVLAPDLRGHGGSDEGDGYALGAFASDLREWAHTLDLRELAVAGWSLGGQVAMALHSLLRPRVRRLILIGTTPRFAAGDGWRHGLPDVQVRAMGRDLRRNYLKTMEDFFALQFEGESLERERYREIVRFAVRDGRLPDPGVAREALETLRTSDQRLDLAALDSPALVMHGDIDRIVPPEAGRFLAEHLPSASLELLPATGHAPFLSRPQEVFEKWRDFLR
jgi:pimeloyl-[acyl-carrier protein] methyl ester esterase